VPGHPPIAGLLAIHVVGEVLTGWGDTHNSFDAPDQVCPVPFTAASLAAGTLRTIVPPMSVVLTLR